jgi:spore germination cell wall hydrolase CwlJ-like protein
MEERRGCLMEKLMTRIVFGLMALIVILWFFDQKAQAATLTTHAKTILKIELEENNINDKEQVKQIMCLAENIYFEARAEGESGKAAVGNVVKNRIADSRWPSTYCDVIYQGPTRESWKTRGKDVAEQDRVFWPVKHRCQFSWYCDGKKDVVWANYEKTGQVIEGNARAWKDSIQLAIYITGWGKLVINDNTHGAVFYYNHNLVSPYWAGSKEYIGVLGNHTFMK